MSVRNKARVMTLATMFLLGLGVVCRAGDAVYTKYNIHVQMNVSRKGERSYQASYSGWVDPGQGHEIIPPNTKVVFEPVAEPVWGKFNKNKTFRLVVLDPAAAGLHADRIAFEFNPTNMAMTVEEYLQLITSPSPVSLSGLTDKDVAGVRSGKVSAGMTKRGVMTAFGYPAAHRTPNPEKDDVWTFWLDRIRTVDVYFDPKGIVQHLSN